MNKNLDELFVYPKELVDEESKRIIHLVEQWANKEIISKRQEYRENYEKLFIEKRKSLNLTIGLQRLTLPEEHGGFGWNSPANAPGIVSILRCQVHHFCRHQHVTPSGKRIVRRAGTDLLR